MDTPNFLTRSIEGLLKRFQIISEERDAPNDTEVTKVIWKIILFLITIWGTHVGAFIFSLPQDMRHYLGAAGVADISFQFGLSIVMVAAFSRLLASFTDVAKFIFSIGQLYVDKLANNKKIFNDDDLLIKLPKSDIIKSFDNSIGDRKYNTVFLSLLIIFYIGFPTTSLTVILLLASAILGAISALIYKASQSDGNSFSRISRALHPLLIACVVFSYLTGEERVHHLINSDSTIIETDENIFFVRSVVSTFDGGIYYGSRSPKGRNHGPTSDSFYFIPNGSIQYAQSPSGIVNLTSNE